jgi:hypothetical protein
VAFQYIVQENMTRERAIEINGELRILYRNPIFVIDYLIPEKGIPYYNKYKYNFEWSLKK